MKIKFYGNLGESLGREFDLDVPDETDTVARLRNVLASQFPEASGDLLKRTRACVADSIVKEDYRLGTNDTVEFFPPLSGG